MAGNAYALPRFAGRLIYRPSEARRRFSSGVTLYPLALLLLIFTLPDRLDIVAAAWGPCLRRRDGHDRRTACGRAADSLEPTKDDRGIGRVRSLRRSGGSFPVLVVPPRDRPGPLPEVLGLGFLAATANHPSWTHMYRMMFLAQVGFAMAYLL